MSGIALATGYAADLAVGDPRRAHPVAAFGRAALGLERRLYGPSRARGAAFALTLVALAAATGEALARVLGRRAALALVTWATLGGRSLGHEAHAIASRLDDGDLDAARNALPALAGRDPEALDAEGISRAVVESVAENTSDAVVGALLWGAVAGPAGAAAFRAANTLDAMVGHRNARYAEFGWAAARLDDALGWPAARAGAGLSAISAPLVGGSRSRAWATLRRDGAAHPSPNAGCMEAAFAGALGIRLGGPLSYDGREEHRPVLGAGPLPRAEDVRRAARLAAAVGALAALICATLSALLARRGTWA